MNKLYNYCCKNCWYMWKTEKKTDKCPKCKSKNLDEDYDLMISE